ncbi:hypothetical protein GSI_02580 [Ganoderma sinense ZZ0214-1]|uniref:Uncharacterized protein n=1 Tax=Ganoderma sinense ZZ0214-1 TaxID=1077348 RepID=A0A2G8SM41_9APHY|nr:hypothetical protein GSI_02580 [Ganoderma sinense ZZ0214-1]
MYARCTRAVHRRARAEVSRLVPNLFIFLPLNAGPRIGLGQQFAYNEISFMLVRLLQRFAAIKLRQHAHPAAVPPPGASAAHTRSKGASACGYGATSRRIQR